MIGFIGLGAAGGNVVDDAVKHGFPGMAINYSQKDLDSLEHVEYRLKLTGSEGVGKNRDEAIRLMETNWESAVSFVKNAYSTPTVEVIIVTFSMAGGSGSGMAPMLIEILMNEMTDKTFVAAPILPDLTEVMVNQMNCLQASEELSNLDICVFPIDNEQIRSQHPYSGKNTIFQKTNESFIAEMKELSKYTTKESKNGVLDQKDLRTIFETKGVAITSATDLSKMEGCKDLSETGIAKAISESWRKSIYAPIQYTKIIRAGFVFDGQEGLMPFIDFGKIFEGFNSGLPLDLFEGYYNEQQGTVHSILAGLPWYTDRLRKIEEMLEERQVTAEYMMKEEQVYQSRIQSLSAAIRPKETKKKSVSDIISKFRK